MTERKEVWEKINDDTQRLVVPGGWIYRTYHFRGGWSMVFVPNPEIPRRVWVKGGLITDNGFRN